MIQFLIDRNCSSLKLCKNLHQCTHPTLGYCHMGCTRDWTRPVTYSDLPWYHEYQGQPFLICLIYCKLQVQSFTAAVRVQAETIIRGGVQPACVASMVLHLHVFYIFLQQTMLDNTIIILCLFRCDVK